MKRIRFLLSWGEAQPHEDLPGGAEALYFSPGMTQQEFLNILGEFGPIMLGALTGERLHTEEDDYFIPVYRPPEPEKYTPEFWMIPDGNVPPPANWRRLYGYE